MNLTAEHLLSIYRELKAHEDRVMPLRPDGHPKADWRMKHPAPVASSFRIYDEGGKQRMGRIIHDTAPYFEVCTWAENSKLVERIDLKDASADAAVGKYRLPAPGDMTSQEFRTIRKSRLGLTQQQLATVFDYANALNISAMERETNPRKIPTHVARLMRAYEAGYRPSDWPVAENGSA